MASHDAASRKRRVPNGGDTDASVKLESASFGEQPKSAKLPRIMNIEDDGMEYAELLYRCQLCVSIPCILTSKEIFLRHIQTRHFTVRDATQKCPRCDLSFETLVDLQAHYDGYHTINEQIEKPVHGKLPSDTQNNNAVEDKCVELNAIVTNPQMSCNGNVNQDIGLYKNTPRNTSPNLLEVNNRDLLDANSGYHSDNNNTGVSVKEISDEEPAELTFSQDYEKHARLIREGGNIVYQCCICKVKKSSYSAFTRHLLSASHKRRIDAKQCSKRLFNGRILDSPSFDSDGSDASATDNPDCNLGNQPNMPDNRTELQKTLDLILAQSSQMSSSTCIVPINNHVPMKRMGRPPKRDQSLLFPYQVSGSNPIDLSIKQPPSDVCKMTRAFYDTSRKYQKTRSMMCNAPYDSSGTINVRTTSKCDVRCKDTLITSDLNPNFISNCGNNMKSLLDDSMSSTHERADLSISSKYVSRLNDMSNNLIKGEQNRPNRNCHISGGGDKLTPDRCNKTSECLSGNESESSTGERNNDHVLSSEYFTTVESPTKFLKLRELLTDMESGGKSPKVEPIAATKWHKTFCRDGNQRGYDDATDLQIVESPKGSNASSGLKNIDSAMMFAAENLPLSCDRCDAGFISGEERSTHILTCPAALYNSAISVDSKEHSMAAQKVT